MDNKVIEIKQNAKCKIELASYTVDWLVNNTMVNVFNPKSPEKFEGYQRQVDHSHRGRIVNYILEKPFYFTSAIICSIPNGKREKDLLLTHKKEMFVVDGQHRIAAFAEIKKTNKNKYEEIKNFTIPVTILRDVDLATEIDTFITINKTGKKVDTSLAYILKNQINNVYTQNDTAKIDYIVVETAKSLCDEDADQSNIWFDKICFEGSAKSNNQYISLNAFILSERKYIRNLIKSSVLSLDDLLEAKEMYFKLFNKKWDLIKGKWDDLFDEESNNRTIIQGAIGVSSINKYLINEIQNAGSINDINQFVYKCLDLVHPSVTSKCWKKGDLFSLYSSESGYRKIAEMLKFGVKE